MQYRSFRGLSIALCVFIALILETPFQPAKAANSISPGCAALQWSAIMPKHSYHEFDANYYYAGEVIQVRAALIESGTTTDIFLSSDHFDVFGGGGYAPTSFVLTIPKDDKYVFDLINGFSTSGRPGIVEGAVKVKVTCTPGYAW